MSWFNSQTSLYSISDSENRASWGCALTSLKTLYTLIYRLEFLNLSHSVLTNKKWKGLFWFLIKSGINMYLTSVNDNWWMYEKKRKNHLRDSNQPTSSTLKYWNTGSLDIIVIGQVDRNKPQFEKTLKMWVVSFTQNSQIY